MGKKALTQDTPWFPDIHSILDGPSGLPRKSGLARPHVHFSELKLIPGAIEVIYSFNAGGCVMEGKLGIPYTPNDELGAKVKEIAELVDEAFHRVRRSR